jgi:hypothetical protein
MQEKHVQRTKLLTIKLLPKNVPRRQYSRLHKMKTVHRSSLPAIITRQKSQRSITNPKTQSLTVEAVRYGGTLPPAAP